MEDLGYFRILFCVPKLYISNVCLNCDEIRSMLYKAKQQGASFSMFYG